MPSPVAHYALGAASLRGFGLPRRDLALASLWAVVPDLDAVPALVWTFLAPHLSVSPDVLIAGGHLFGHRGFSHTLVAAGLAALVAFAWTRRARAGAIAGTAWGTHVVFDALTEWPTRPFWPLSLEVWHWPVFTVLDPIVTVAALGATVGLLGPVVVDRLDRPSMAFRRRLERFARRWAVPLAFATVGAIVLSGGFVAWAAASTGAEATLPARTPRTVTLDRGLDEQPDAWNATTRWLPVTDGQTREIERVANRTDATPAGIADTADCALEALGPYAPIERPTWTIERSGDAWLLSGRDLLRQAIGDEGPGLLVEVEDGRVTDAWLAPGDEPGGFRVPLPTQLVEERECP